MHRIKLMEPGLKMIAVVALVITAWLGALVPGVAQGKMGIVIGATIESSNLSPDGVRFTVETESGEFLGACTIQNSGPGVVPACVVDFPFAPSGTLTVTEDVSTLPAGYAPVENPIHVDVASIGAASHDVVFHNVPTGAGQGQTSDVAIVTTENGQPVYDACYVLVDFSNEGCDRNADGQITFEDVPLGTYTLRQTADLGPGRSVPDSTITVTGAREGDGWERFHIAVGDLPGASGQTGSVDIALVTRAPEDGRLLTGTCYVLLGYSNEGCDRNGDGQVTFDAIPYGTYTVRQTQAPAGYPVINDYDIVVEPVGGMEGASAGVPLGFIVRQAPEQNAPDTRNVSVVFIDSTTSEKVMADVCVEFVGGSNVGCDRDLIDGQIDFLDLLAGTYELRFELPPGYWVGNVGGPVTIDAGPGTPANVFVFVELVSS